jgi:hypothetical protein
MPCKRLKGKSTGTRLLLAVRSLVLVERRFRFRCLRVCSLGCARTGTDCEGLKCSGTHAQAHMHTRTYMHRLRRSAFEYLHMVCSSGMIRKHARRLQCAIRERASRQRNATHTIRTQPSTHIESSVRKWEARTCVSMRISAGCDARTSSGFTCVRSSVITSCSTSTSPTLQTGDPSVSGSSPTRSYVACGPADSLHSAEP